MVKSDKLYSPENYLEAVTGKYFIVRGDDDITEIEAILDKCGYRDELWNYPLSEIEHISENDIDVVLVDCMVYNEDKKEFEHVYRWFEVPEDFKEEEE